MTHSLGLFSKRGIYRWVQYIFICVGLAGCAAPDALIVPSTGAGAAAGLEQPAVGQPAEVEQTPGEFRVIEYPLVEQSLDNPNNPGFAARVVEAVANRRAGFGLFNQTAAVEDPNRLLEPFGYHLAPSSEPPYSSYVLYHDGTAVVRDIARFWKVESRGTSNFSLVLATHSGDLLSASNHGLDVLTSRSGASDNRLAYAGSGDTPLMAGGPQHAENVAGAVFQQQIDGHALVLYYRERLAHLSYAGEELPNMFDAVMFGGGPESAMYQPGSAGQVIWFYALRDGLWYYVEAGLME